MVDQVPHFILVQIVGDIPIYPSKQALPPPAEPVEPPILPREIQMKPCFQRGSNVPTPCQVAGPPGVGKAQHGSPSGVRWRDASRLKIRDFKISWFMMVYDNLPVKKRTNCWGIRYTVYAYTIFNCWGIRYTPFSHTHTHPCAFLELVNESDPIELAYDLGIGG